MYSNIFKQGFSRRSASFPHRQTSWPVTSTNLAFKLVIVNVLGVFIDYFQHWFVACKKCSRNRNFRPFSNAGVIGTYPSCPLNKGVSGNGEKRRSSSSSPGFKVLSKILMKNDFDYVKPQKTEVVTRRCSVKKVSLKISKIFTRKHQCQSLFLNKLQAWGCTFIRKETLAYVFLWILRCF